MTDSTATTPARPADCAHCGIVISSATRAAHTNCFPEHRQPGLKAADRNRCTIVIDGERCPKPLKARDWCNGHLQRWTKHGNPTSGRNRRSSGALLALVQDAAHTTTDQCVLAPCKNSRPSLNYRGKPTIAARAVWIEANGEDPEHPIRFTCGQGDAGCINIRHLYLDQPNPNALCTVCNKPAEPGNPFKGTEHAAYCYQRARRNASGQGPCATPECGRPVFSGDLCNRCYQRAQRGNDPAARAFHGTNMGRACKTEWCTNPARRRGWCEACAAWSRYNDGTDPTVRRYRYNRSVEDILALVATIEAQPGTGCRDGSGVFPQDVGGYCLTSVSGKTNVRVTRLVVAHGLGREMLPRTLACHTCDNPPCVEESHLWEGTPADNMADRDAKGRGARGRGNGRARLDAAAVRDIRTNCQPGTHRNDSNVSAIAAQYGVKPQAIRDVLSRRTWAHVK